MSKVSLINGHIDGANTCVICGRDIPEDSQVCVICGKTEPRDLVEVVRCKDCEHCCISTDPKTNISIQKCGYVGFNPVQSSQVSDDFFCSYGERRESEVDTE